MAATTPETEEAQREAFRKLHQVRLVQEAEEGTGVDRLPAGVYGFTHSPVLENSPLYRKMIYYTFEVHKAQDGAVYLIGFLPPDVAARVESSKESLEIRLFPEPQDSASAPVSLPVARLRRSKDQSFRDGDGLELQALPVQRLVP